MTIPAEARCPHCGDMEPNVLGVTWVRDRDGTFWFRCIRELANRRGA